MADAAGSNPAILIVNEFNSHIIISGRGAVW